MTSPARYFREVAQQVRKVRWPSFNLFIKTFLIVLLITIIASLILYFETWTGVKLIDSLKSVFKGI